MPDTTESCDIVNEVLPDTESRPAVPPHLAPKMLAMMKAINELQAGLEPLVEKPHYEVLAKLIPLERAKVQVMEAVTVNSLFWALMKLDDKPDPKLEADHRIEMCRTKEGQQRISEIEARANMQRIDRAAARRFIHHGLGKSNKRSLDIAKTEVEDVEDEEDEEEECEPELPRAMKRKKNSKIQAEIDAAWK